MNDKADSVRRNQGNEENASNCHLASQLIRFLDSSHLERRPALAEKGTDSQHQTQAIPR
jgi:hypothetical protein